MQVKCSVVGALMTNCYMVLEDDTCVLVDPGAEPDTILGMLDGRKPDMILITHGHMDHIGALPKIIEATGSPVAAYSGEVERITHPDEFDMKMNKRYVPLEKIDVVLEDGQKLQVGKLNFEVIHTPGHTEGGVCYYVPEYDALFSGDTLFAGTCGRTDFEGGDPFEMRESLKRLAALPAETQVLPGHDRLTTIGTEVNWMSRG